MCIFDKFEVELIEISLYVNTLKLRVNILVNKHEIGVNFKAAIIAKDQANHVAFSIFAWLFLGDGAVLEELGRLHLSRIDQDSQLHQLQGLRFVFIVGSQEANLAGDHIFEDKGRHTIANLLDADYFVLRQQIEEEQILRGNHNLNEMIVLLSKLQLARHVVINYAIARDIHIDNGVSIRE